MRSYIFIKFPKNRSNQWYQWFFTKLILEVTNDRKEIKNEELLEFLKKMFFAKAHKFIKKKVKDRYEKEEETIEVTRKIKKYPYQQYYNIRSKNLYIYKKLLKNWIAKDGILLFEKMIFQIFKAVQNPEIMKPHLLKIFLTFSYNKEAIIWNSLKKKQDFLKNKLIIYNNMYNNFDTSGIFSEIQRSSKDHNLEYEKLIRGSIKPIAAFNKYYRKPNIKETKLELPVFGLNNDYKHYESSTILSNIDPFFSEKRANRDYFYKLDPFFQKYMKLQKIKSLQVNVNVDLGSKRMITAKFLSTWLKSLFKKGRKLTYVLRTLDRFIKPANNYIGAASVLFAGRFTRSAYTTYKYYRFGRLNSGEIHKQMDYSHIEFTTKFGMCGIKVKLQYKPNIFANRDLANYLKTAILGSELVPYKFNSNLHLPMLIKYGSKKIFRLNSKLDYKNNLPFYQFK